MSRHNKTTAAIIDEHNATLEEIIQKIKSLDYVSADVMERICKDLSEEFYLFKVKVEEEPNP